MRVINAARPLQVQRFQVESQLSQWLTQITVSNDTHCRHAWAHARSAAALATSQDCLAARWASSLSADALHTQRAALFSDSMRRPQPDVHARIVEHTQRLHAPFWDGALRAQPLIMLAVEPVSQLFYSMWAAWGSALLREALAVGTRIPLYMPPESYVTRTAGSLLRQGSEETGELEQSSSLAASGVLRPRRVPGLATIQRRLRELKSTTCKALHVYPPASAALEAPMGSPTHASHAGDDSEGQAYSGFLGAHVGCEAALICSPLAPQPLTHNISPWKS